MSCRAKGGSWAAVAALIGAGFGGNAIGLAGAGMAPLCGPVVAAADVDVLGAGSGAAWPAWADATTMLAANAVTATARVIHRRRHRRVCTRRRLANRYATVRFLPVWRSIVPGGIRHYWSYLMSGADVDPCEPGKPLCLVKTPLRRYAVGAKYAQQRENQAGFRIPAPGRTPVEGGA